MGRNKFTRTDFRSIVIGLAVLGFFIYLRYSLTGRLYDWLLAIFDYMIGIFGGGVLLFILNEMFGKNLLSKITK